MENGDIPLQTRPNLRDRPFKFAGVFFIVPHEKKCKQPETPRGFP